MLENAWSWIEKNRFLVIGILAGVFFAIYPGCNVPQVVSPLDGDKFVDNRGLQVELKEWQAQQETMAAKFEAAGQDLQEQIDAQQKIDKLINAIAASPDPASWPGIFLAGGGLLAIIDNIRKRGVISGLKRNK